MTTTQALGWMPTDVRGAAGAELPDDRPIDRVDRSPHLFGAHEHSNRDHLLTFIGGALVAVRWNQWRTYTATYHLAATNPSLAG